MPLDFPNIVPENNLRLPDALTIKHGPARLLARFVLEGDKKARGMGLELRLRTDFDELLYLNRQETVRGNWYRLLNPFNPEYVDLTPENAFWIAGYDEHGEIVTTYALHIYDWRDTNLKEQAYAMFYGREQGAPGCTVTAEAAEAITGIVGKGGAAWVRPDWRGKQVSHLMPRMSKAYASARWPIDWVIGYVKPPLVRKGIAAGYGSKHTSYSIFYPQSAWGDLEVALIYTSVEEIYEDLTDYLTSELMDAPEFNDSDLRRVLEQSVMNTSSEVVFQGSNTRS
jgi:GNAT superfamily N-acetyltransferase